MYEIKNQKGSALIIAILVLTVLMILSTAMVSITSSNYKMSHAERRYLSAYYVAEAGVRHQIEHMRTLAEELQQRGHNTDTLVGFFTLFNTRVLSAPLNLGNQGSDPAHAEIVMGPIPSGGNPRRYTFISTGTVGGVTRRIQAEVLIDWVSRTPIAQSIFQKALFTQGDMDLGGSVDITGGAGTNGRQLRIGGNADVKGGTSINMNLPIPAIILPYSTRSTTVLTANNGITTINSSGNFESIDVGATLRFNLDGRNLSIQTETLDLGSNGRIETTGNGTLFLHVTGNSDIKFTGGNINPPLVEGGLSRAIHFVMFVTRNIEIDFGGNFKFSGGLYAPNAELRARGNATSLSGSIIVDTADAGGSVQIHHEVVAPVELLPPGFSTGSPTPPSPRNIFRVISWNEP